MSFDDNEDILWSLLNKEARFIKNNIENDWLDLLDANKREQEYQSFIENHAGFFFYESYQDVLVISKLKLGADFVTDFVICTNDASNGLRYELIELEKPSSLLYTKRGNPTASFTHSVQQILNWKRWIISNLDTARKLFPTQRYNAGLLQNFEYTIIIGRRYDEKDYLYNELRNSYAHDLGINIRSYDSLTDDIRKSYFMDNAPLFDEHNLKLLNEFANPFFKPYNDATWRTIVQSKNLNVTHMLDRNVELFVNKREYNQLKQSEFLDYLSKKAK